MDWPPLTATKQLTFDDYTVAWITALPHEKTAARNMLDELHLNPQQSESDKNVYTFGSICGHNVVIVCQGDMGTEAAAVVAARMDMAFQNLRFGLLVGIAGGVPDRKDVRLGDVVISQGDGISGGIVSHDHGKVTPMGFMSRPFLNDVPELLKKAFVELKSQLMDRDSKIPSYISAATVRNPRFIQFNRPDVVDHLFKSDYIHVNPRDDICDQCIKTEDYLVARKLRIGLEDLPFVHFGVVASGNQVIKDGIERRRISQTHPSVIAVEMEAAGLMNIFGCATIRGICDYADSHKNDGWQNYAAATAAACAREVLEIIPAGKISVSTNLTLSAEENECLKCLCTSDYGSYKHLVPEAIPGTCSWILQNQKHSIWENERRSSILWLSGGPGTGKSVLSSFLISQLQNHRSNSPFSGTVLFFLFKDNEETQKTASSALCALLHQLLTIKRSLVKYATQEFRIKGPKFINEFSTLCRIFLQAIADNDCGDITCIVDGLDECEGSSREYFVEFLANLCSKSESRSNIVKLLVTSRPDPSIEDSCYKSSIIRLKIEDETAAVNSDIELFVKDKVKEYNSRNELSDVVQTYLEEKLVEKADRTFLWVSLIIQVMKRKPRPNKKEKVDKFLDALPRQLDALYEKILQQVAEDDEDDGDEENQNSRKRLLHILVAAARPLSLEEMGVALVIRPSNRSYDDLDMHASIGDTIERLCGPFLRIIESKVYLVHQSAKEFLVRDTGTRLTRKNKWRHTLDTAESNYILSNICITYLLFTVFESHPLVLPGQGSGAEEWSVGVSERGSTWMYSDVREEIQRYTDKHSFLDYAGKYWGEHFREAGVDIDGHAPLLKLALDVCDNQTSRFITWFQVYWTTVDSYCLCPQGFTSLMVASNLGHEAVVQLLLEKRVDLESRDSNGGTALHRAAENGHAGVARMLLDHGALLDATDILGLTALMWAAKNARHEVVELLFEYEANAEVESHWGQTALHLAAQQGHEAIVRLLLDKIPNIDLDKGKYSPLQLAAAQGHESVVRLLLDRGASINSNWSDGGTALHCAVAANHDHIIKLLIDGGANLDAKSGHFSFLFISDASKGIVRLGKVGMGGSNGGQTALHLAVMRGCEKVVKLLLGRGANPNMKDEEERTALHWAVEGEEVHQAIIDLLLRYGSDVNARTTRARRWEIGRFRIGAKEGRGFTALHLAAFYGDESTVQLLLNYQADVNAKAENGITALHLAAYNGYEGTVRTLLKHGADPEVRDEEGQTVLEWTTNGDQGHPDWRRKIGAKIYFNYHEVVRLLIDEGIDINAKDLYGQTAIHQAAKLGYAAMVSLLLEKGADPMATDGEEWTALHWTASRKLESEAVVHLSLHNRANIDMGQEEAIRLLLKKANTNLRSTVKGMENYPAAYVKLNDTEAGKAVLEMKENFQGNDGDARKQLESAIMRLADENEIGVAVRLLLENGANIIFGREDIARQLIKRGANIEARDENGLTALHVAISKGNLAIAQILLDSGANPQAKSGTGITALSVAVESGDVAMVQLLLEKNTGMDLMFDKGMTLLHLAANLGHEAVTQLLLEKGVNTHAFHEDGMTPLHLAVLSGNVGVVRRLLNWTDIDVRTGKGSTALHLAIKTRHQAAVELLLECGADIGIEDNFGRTALHLAAQEGYDTLILQLISMKYDINMEDHEFSALQIASSQGHESTVRLLLEKGADLNEHRDGYTPLHWAVNGGNEAMVQILLDQGADINATGNSGKIIHITQYPTKNGSSEKIRIRKLKGGETALHLAIGLGREAIIRLLLSRNADPNIRDQDQWAPLHWAVVCSENREGIIRLLLEKGADVNMKISKARRRMITSRNDKADQPQLIDKERLTALHLAAFSNYEAITELLINNGVDINTKDQNGITALHLASYFGYEAVTRLLLEKGADPSIRDNSGQTALHWAVNSLQANCPPGFEELLERRDFDEISLPGFPPLEVETERGRDAVVKLLLLVMESVDPNLRDNNSNTPLSLATKHGRRFAIKLLLGGGNNGVETYGPKTTESDTHDTNHQIHPHQGLHLPLFSSTLSSKMVEYPKNLPLEKVAAKLGEVGTEKPVVTMMRFLSEKRGNRTIPIVPDLTQWSELLQISFKRQPSENIFPLIDIFRLALMDARVLEFYAKESNHTTIQALLETATVENASYQLRLVTLHTICNLFSTPLFPPYLVEAPLITLLLELVTSSLLSQANPRLRVSAVSLIFNITNYNQKIRAGCSISAVERVDAISDDDQIQLLAIIIEGLNKEKESVEVLVGLTLSLGLIVYGAKIDGDILNFVKVQEARKITGDKLKIFTERNLLGGNHASLCAEIGEGLLGNI